jgi:hypothetical protein
MRSVLAAAGLLCAATTGCGYTTASLVQAEYRTIGIPVFDNGTRRHDLEWELSRAVSLEIQARTHLRIVDPADSPDLLLEGTLVDVDEDVLSSRSRQRIRESSVRLAADVTVTAPATGKVVVERTRVYERESFVPIVGEDLRTAREDAVRALAERIVRQLESGW